MYYLLEILHPDKYRPKLPTFHDQEVRSNILQAKKMLSSQDQSSNVGSSRVSNIESIIARLTSNPPPAVRNKQQLAPLNIVKPN